MSAATRVRGRKRFRNASHPHRAGQGQPRAGDHKTVNKAHIGMLRDSLQHPRCDTSLASAAPQHIALCLYCVLDLLAFGCEYPGVGLAPGLTVTGVDDQPKALQAREEL